MKYIKLVSALIFLFSCTTILNAQYDPHVKYGKAIDAFEKMDSVNHPNEGGILFIGSSSFTKWQDVNDYFPDKYIINRGFGGSQMSDLLYFKERLILPYKPKQIVVFVGGNDITAGEKARSVFKEDKELVKWTLKQFPDVDFLFLSLKPTPKRWALKDEMIRLSKKRERYALKNRQVDYVDVWTPLLNDEGMPKEGIYIADQLHLNAKGYKIWQQVMAPYLK
ncbi:GDSL-type esterase/lipase family protein [Carboxylicivirga caseinilyticus]|uniref:GDSL-type esterase/lipase family protein n=1 Tax=Carboxylicivirga caseinilyticus TaxID=3417572 RepID=UPI003D32592F|nr:hypothetical protein [Marinilabiliaceae bacterium A049]